MTSRLVLIVGSGYSGSTLLDMLIGSHPQALSVGELRKFDQFADGDFACTCQIRFSQCPFWAAVVKRLETDGFRLMPPSAGVDHVVQQTLRLLDALWDTSRAKVIVDSSKSVDRARLLQESGKVNACVVQLVRDGRGVAWSHLKRGQAMQETARKWRSQNDRILQWLNEDGAPPHLRVRYEDLATRPEEVVRKVCTLAELDYTPDMLNFRRHEHHLVSGNMMRFVLDAKIQLDTEWQTSLSSDELKIFEELAGDLARYFGY